MGHTHPRSQLALQVHTLNQRLQLNSLGFPFASSTSAHRSPRAVHGTSDRPRRPPRGRLTRCFCAKYERGGTRVGPLVHRRGEAHVAQRRSPDIFRPITGQTTASPAAGRSAKISSAENSGYRLKTGSDPQRTGPPTRRHPSQQYQLPPANTPTRTRACPCCKGVCPRLVSELPAASGRCTAGGRRAKQVSLPGSARSRPDAPSSSSFDSSTHYSRRELCSPGRGEGPGTSSKAGSRPGTRF